MENLVIKAAVLPIIWHVSSRAFISIAVINLHGVLFPTFSPTSEPKGNYLNKNFPKKKQTTKRFENRETAGPPEMKVVLIRVQENSLKRYLKTEEKSNLG